MKLHLLRLVRLFFPSLDGCADRIAVDDEAGDARHWASTPDLLSYCERCGLTVHRRLLIKAPDAQSRPRRSTER